MTYYKIVLRLLADLEQANVDIIDDLFGESLDILYHAKFIGIGGRIKIQKRMISIKLYITSLTFVLHILIISDSTVLNPLPSIPS